MNKMLKKLKFYLAIALPVFLLLPIGSCERKQVNLESGLKIESGDAFTTSGLQPPTPAPHRKDYLVLIRGPMKSIAYWVCLFAFIWPILLIQIRRGMPGINRFRVTLNILELVLTGLTLFIAYSALFNLWYKPTVWGYGLLLVMVAYSLALLIETVLLYLWKSRLMPEITSG